MCAKRTWAASQILFLIACVLATHADARSALDSESILERMEAAYAGITDYRSRLEVRVHGRHGSIETKEFFYTFKKPNHIRIDFISPYAGTVLVYPDRNGKVLLTPSGWARIFKLRLAPDSFLLRNPSGQRIDQTDLGVLIRNISHSLRERRRGQVNISADNGMIHVAVVADNHFREGVLTRYQFIIDRKLWLPIGVKESTPDGTLERTVIFRDLRVNIGVPDNAFQLNGG